LAGASRACADLEERPGCAGALRTLGVWGAISGPPMSLVGGAQRLGISSGRHSTAPKRV
jgi:hypothetical protein